MTSSPNTPVYLDYNATTPLDPDVAKSMLPYLQEHFGNPSSQHVYGQQTKAAIVTARTQVATMLGCTPDEILFTSGGTESNNTVLFGTAAKRKADGNHIIISAIEHPAIEMPCRILEQQGFRVSRIPVDGHGQIQMEAFREALTPDTILVSIMHANNEVGTLQPIAEIAQLARHVGAWVHTDASQSIGKVPVDVTQLNVDFLTVAGHKLYAPKGIGALYLRKGRELPPFMHGAGHEGGRRAGTENVLEIVGLGTAASLVTAHIHTEVESMRTLRDELWTRLQAGITHIQRHGHPTDQLPNTLHIGIQHRRAHLLLEALQDDVAASAGSACHADQVSISHVLQSMNVDESYAAGSLRLSIGRFTTKEDIELAANAIIRVANQPS
jgi:cysteine desulfurase